MCTAPLMCDAWDPFSVGRAACSRLFHVVVIHESNKRGEDQNFFTISPLSAP
jgi:hypothetical protein